MINSKEYWDKKFQLNWQENGLNQSNIFASDGIHFIGQYLDLTGKNIVDFGCGIGVSCQHFQQAGVSSYVGVDHSSIAIDESKRLFPDFDWICGGIDAIPPCDIIFVSNVVEHLAEWKVVVKKLAGKCDNLVVLVPYEEEVRYKSPEHINFFNEDSLNFLNVSVRHRIYRSKGWGLWGWNLWLHCHAKNVIKVFLGRRPRRIGRQIGFITGV